MRNAHGGNIRALELKGQNGLQKARGRAGICWVALGQFSTKLAELDSRPTSALRRKQSFQGLETFGIPVDYGRRVVDDEMVLGLATLARVSRTTRSIMTP
jgi:hypothetical protein